MSKKVCCGGEMSPLTRLLLFLTVSMLLSLDPKQVNVGLQFGPLAKINGNKMTPTFLFSKHCYGHQSGVDFPPKVCCITPEPGQPWEPHHAVSAVGLATLGEYGHEGLRVELSQPNGTPYVVPSIHLVCPFLLNVQVDGCLAHMSPKPPAVTPEIRQGVWLSASEGGSLTPALEGGMDLIKPGLGPC